MKDWQYLFKMKLGEFWNPEKESKVAGISILRVPGGWIFNYYTPVHDNCTFVPNSIAAQLDNKEIEKNLEGDILL